MSDAVYLILENGMIFTGKSFGHKGEVIGETVFTTGMTGYLETLTDQSYYGQIVTQTFPLIGNYGVIPSDFESPRIGASAYIVKYPCQDPSNFRSEGNLDTFLRQQKIVGIYGIDTRALTKVIRQHGVMNGKITAADPKLADLDEIKHYTIRDSAAHVSSKKVQTFPAANRRFRVVLLDLGLKENIKQELLKRGCEVWVFPYDSTPADILKCQPDGLMLSNGPGDPKDNPLVIRHISQLLKQKLPIFGICLGHQLLALAHGFETEKLKYGHRGANHPVKDLKSGRIYITSQNHGYAVSLKSIDNKIADLSFINNNDHTCEGITYKQTSAFSVQFHPEACAGPLDTAFLFDQFIKNMEVHKHARG